MKPDRYRAYTAAKATKKAVEVNPDTMKAHRIRHEYDVEDVAFEGKTDGDAASFDAGDTAITRVVFLKTGKDDAGEKIETVVGSVDVGTSGHISVTCPEPVTAPDPTEIV
jgi:hypothetical protein